MKYASYVLGVFAFGALLFFYEIHLSNEALLIETPAPSLQNDVSSSTGALSPLSLIVVRSEADKEHGLGDRASLPANTGMLFVFSQPSAYGIWMKDMQFSIDIISLDENFSVVHVEPNVSSSTYPKVFYSPATTKYIIETNAGWAQKNNVKVGDVIDSAKKAV